MPISETEDFNGVEFDYIVVGAGSAGGVLAARLSENPSNRVALLEAGGTDKHVLLNMPAGILGLRKTRPFDWGYQSQPMQHCRGRTLGWPRGKVLGGSSSINGMQYIRGNRLDYDQWAQMGLDGWEFDNCLPYFKKSENNTSKLNDPYHSQSGPLTVTDARGGTPLFKAFLDAAEQAGFPQTDDFNGAQQEGFGYFQFSIHKGERASTAKAYIHPAAKRANLAVVVQAHATRILFDDKRAVGIEYSQLGTRKRIRARKEVVICAGVINSPQLLMLSGLGPAFELTTHGIDVIADLPGVGENLQDHFDYLVGHECLTDDTFDIYNTSPFRRLWAGLRYVLWRGGPGVGVPLDVGGFLKTTPDLERPDIELQMLGALLDDNIPQGGFQIHVTLLHPRSRGRVGLRGKDPFMPPLIFPNFLSSESDRMTIREGVKKTRHILSQPALNPYRGREVQPGEPIVTDEELDRDIARHGEMDHHAVGTCAMGIGNYAVVDHQCRVKNVEALRVVDASIMPLIVSGNTNAPTIMIAEKMADAILGKTATS